MTLETTTQLAFFGRPKKFRTWSEENLRTAYQSAGEDLAWFPAPRPSLARVIALASVEGQRGHGLVSAARQRGAARCA